MGGRADVKNCRVVSFQLSANRRMRTRTTIAWRVSASLTVGLLACCTLSEAQVSKWVDESGVVHYGDSVPEKFRNSAKIVPLRNDAPSAAQVRAAQLRSENQRAALASGHKASETAASSLIPASATEPLHEASCHEQWQQFRNVEDCFAPYRNATGGIKPEAFDHCPVIKEPVNCPISSK